MRGTPTRRRRFINVVDYYPVSAHGRSTCARLCPHLDKRRARGQGKGKEEEGRKEGREREGKEGTVGQVGDGRGQEGKGTGRGRGEEEVHKCIKMFCEM